MAVRRAALILATAALAACGQSAGPARGALLPARTPEAATPSLTPLATPVPTPTPSPAPAPPSPAAGAGPVALAGCPPPPSKAPPGGPPWHPDKLVPDSALPAPLAPVPGNPSLAALTGKGMWIWQWPHTEGGNIAAIVARARAAGLRQLWVRVADSRDRFYAADELSALVPLAHRAGMAVIAWGFPFLYDPVDDAAWTADALNWRAADGEGVDGWAADIETPSEGVMLADLRISVYLGLVRRSVAGRPLIGTVYPPNDLWWSNGYPYRSIARYVDAFAPMLYWECKQPGDYAAQAIARLQPMRPVHLIGQAFSLGPYGGRVDSPSAEEEQRFLDTARRGGALGASLWAWQLADAEEWGALSAYSWPGR